MLDRISQHPVFHPRRTVAAALSLAALLCMLPVTLVQGRPTLDNPEHSTPAAITSTAKVKATKVARVSKAHKTTAGQNAVTSTKTRLVLAAPVKTAVLAAVKASDGLTLTVFSLQYAKATDATATLRHLYQSSDLGIIADPRTNAVIIRGTKAEIAEVTSALTNLDQPTPQDAKLQTPRSTRLFRLMYAKAEDTAGIIGSTIGAHNAVVLSFDPRTNSVIAVADARKMDQIDHLIRELDIPFDEAITRRIQVHFVKADEMMKMIGEHMRSIKDFSITTDTRDNTIVVTASQNDVQRIQMLINLFDYGTKN